MHGLADLHLERLTTRHLERFSAGLVGQAFPVTPVGAVSGILLHHQVEHIAHEVGEGPGQLGIAADGDARLSREGEALDVEGAVAVEGGAVQPHLRPHRRVAHLQVRVIADDGLARRGVTAGDDERVGADAWALAQGRRNGVEDPLRLLERLGGSPECAGLGGGRGAGRGGLSWRGALRGFGAVGGLGLLRRHRDRVGDGVVGAGPQVARPVVEQDRPAGGLVGGREQLLDRGRAAQLREQLHTPRLTADGAEPQVQHLELGQRVDAVPRLDVADGQAQSHHRVFVGHLPRSLPLEVGVDPVGVGLVEAAGLVGQQVPLLLGDAPQAHGAHRDVRLLASLTDQLGQPSGGHVAAQVHLEEALLSLHIALPEEQVVVAGGVDVGDALRVAAHGDLVAGPGERDRAVVLRQRRADDGDEHRPRDEGERDDATQRDEQPVAYSASGLGSVCGRGHDPPSVGPDATSLPRWAHQPSGGAGIRRGTG